MASRQRGRGDAAVASDDLGAVAPPTDAEASPRPQDTIESATSNFPIVGLGASAGGLAAFEAFFSGMPDVDDPGMAFVLVQHLAPDHKSILTDLVRRYTRMRVFEVEDGMVVQPNCAYIIPPGRDMALLNGALQLLEPSAPRGLRLPIDFFFRSLALDQRERAIAIVLSGTGSDGTQGIRAVKGEGGMVMVQRPETTEYDGMPRSAIATGLADYELSPAEMPAQLVAYVARALGRSPWTAEGSSSEPENALKKTLILLRAHTGHDFSQYKPSTVRRRIERRLAVNQIETVDGYVKYLQQAPSELDSLFRDLLIGVTSFFRDPEAFQVLEELVVPQVSAARPSDATIRVWVPGCSTGEEAYSIAILFAERQEVLKQGQRVQVFATDIDGQAIALARIGLYPASIAPDVPSERLARFFAAEPGGAAYRIQKRIRDMLVFSEQDLIKDPPFSKLDLISCRNLLIYMSGSLQKKVIPLFQYALNPGGFLFLGTSETVGDSGELFATVDRKAKLYRRKEDSNRSQLPALRRAAPEIPATETVGRRRTGPAQAVAASPLRQLTERALLQHVAAAAVLVRDRGDILYLHGRTGLYLEPAPGEAGVNNILKMAREGLKRDLAGALREAADTGKVIHRPGLRISTNDHFVTANLTVRPVTEDPSAIPGTRLYLVVLEEAPALDLEQPRPPASPPAQGPASVDEAADARIAALNQELQAKDEHLQAATEALETSNEELKSSNEEMQSVNEELQSTNEELETSKEELQSINEELSTVNAELQSKVIDLTRINNDMTNLLSATGIATVFVDHSLRILRFTPAATRIINLIPGDVGRPVGHLVSNLEGYDALSADTQTVLDTLVPKDVEVRSKAGEWYTLRILPYRTLDNVIEGAVITFVDITEAKRAREAVREAHLRVMEAIVETVHEPVLVLDAGLRIVSANPAFYHTFRVDQGSATGRLLYEFDDGQWNTPAVRNLLEELLSHKDSGVGERVLTHHSARVGSRSLRVNACAVDEMGRPAFVILAIESIAQRHDEGTKP